MSLFPYDIYKLFGQGNPFQGINDLFKGLEELAMAIAAAIIIALIILVVILIVAGVGLGTITGMVFKKAASDELDEAETGSTTVTSQIRGCLILLVGPVFGVAALLSSFSAFLAAENRGFDEAWLPVVMIQGVVVGIVVAGWYQRRRIRRLGKEKANGMFFLFGLLISCVFIAVMGSVSVTSLVYIAWQRVVSAVEPTTEMTIGEKLNAEVQFDSWPNHGHIIGIRWQSKVPHEPLTKDWLMTLQGLERVENLALSGPQIDDEFLRHLSKMPNLKNLDFTETEITITGLKHLNRMNLTKLTIPPKLMTETCLSHYANAMNGELDIRDWNITAESIEQLKGQNLSSLELPNSIKTDIGLSYYLRAIKSPADLQLSSWAITFAGLKQLREIALTDVEFPAHLRTDEGLEVYVSIFPNKLMFDLEDWMITTSGLSFLKGKNLHRLDLPKNLYTDGGLRAYLAAIVPSTKLDLRSWKITDKGLEYLRDQAQLTSLTLKSLPITDEGLKHIRHLPSLKYLDLSRTGVTIRGVALLSSLPTLKEIRMVDTDEAASDKEQLRKTLPSCRFNIYIDANKPKK